jgi:hypothetical protein
MAGTGEPRYLVLADRAVPYLLARVRWPDIAQAITARSPDWLDDPGLFDLPYDPGAVTVSFPQAACVAAGWGRQLHPGAAAGVPSYIRRMPANWSDLSPSERRAWGIEFVGRGRSSPRRVRRLRSSRAMVAASSAVSSAAPSNGHVPAFAATNGRGSAATERRREMRVRVDGRAHIRCGDTTTMSAGLVDLSEAGVGCVLPEGSPLASPGATLGGPFLLEADVTTSRICLDVAGQITWQRGTGAGTQFGVVFGHLDEAESEGVRRFLAAACSRRGAR